MRKLLIAAFVLSAIVSSITAQDRGLRASKKSSDQRIALVIGNGAYKDAPLQNPVNDARDLSRALAEIGFEVMFRQNLHQKEMKEAIRTFGERLRNGEIGLFYYAGHGAQVAGRNYLIPVGAVINNEYEVEYEAVDVGLVIAQMTNAANRTNIVILDACRNNPFARSFRSAAKGLASIDAPSGTLIAYATAPGSVASDGESKNGLYTQELLKSMRVPDLQIEQVFKRVRAAVQEKTEGKQVPWESSSLVGDFYFLASKPNNADASRRLETSSPDTRINTPSLKPNIQTGDIKLFADDGNGNPGPQVSSFRPTDRRMHFEMATDGLEKGMKVKWVYTVVETLAARDLQINETGYEVIDPTKRFLSSSLGLPRDWLPGKYKVEVYINNELIGSLEYKVQ